MFIGEFATERLIWENFANFRREKILFLTSYVDELDLGVRKSDVVLWGPLLVFRSHNPKENRRTFLEVLLDSDRTKVAAIEFVLAGVQLMQFLNGLLVAQMRGLHSNSFDEPGGVSIPTVLAELPHGYGQILGLIEGRSTSIDVDHELLPSWSNRRVETFPCLDASAKAYRSHSTRSEEESVATNHDTLPSGAAWKRGENQVKSRNDWQDLVSSVLSGEETLRQSKIAALTRSEGGRTQLDCWYPNPLRI